MDTNLYLDKVKDRYDLVSDGDLYRLLDINKSRLSGYRNYPRTMDDELAFKVEKLLKLPEGSIVYDMYSQRSKCTKSKKLFANLSKQLISGSMAAALALSAFSISTNLTGTDHMSVQMPDTVYYVKWCIYSYQLISTIY